jgi:tetratricopeptide (TPR) repeat protein
MSTANDRAVLNMILNPLLPNEPFDPNGNPNPADPCESLPRFSECRELEKAGIYLAEKEKFDEAIEKFNAASEICPQNPHPYNNRAQAYRMKNKVEEALNDLNKSIELSNGEGKAACAAYTQRAMIYLLKEEKDKAKIDFQKAANLGSSFAKMQLVSMNPYAAMCNQMLSEVVGKLQRGEE